MLSLSRLHGFLLGLGLLFLVWRVWRAVVRRRVVLREELRALVGAVVLLALFVGGGLLSHRPMLRLEGQGSNLAAVDFHSHTSASHDVRGTAVAGFDTKHNLEWHQRAGFDAVFITDHNTTAGLVPVDVAGGALPRPRGERVAGAHRPAGWSRRSRQGSVSPGLGGPAAAAGGRGHRLRITLGRLAPGIRALSLGTARLAGRRGPRRLRDRERLPQGQRAHPRASRHGDRARPAHRASSWSA